MNSNITRKAVIAAITANIIWGFSFMATRIAISYTTPPMLLSIRFIASFFVMLLIVLAGAAKVDLKGKPLGKFILMGLCEPVIYFIAETYGIKFTTASFSGLMISLIPIGTAALSVVVLKEKLSRRRMGWILCSVAGVAMISVSQTSEGAILPRGVFFLLIAIASASFYTILSKSIASQFTAFERTFIMMLMGCAVFTVQAVISEGRDYIPQLSAALHNSHVMLPVLFLSVISSVIAFFCLNYSMTHLEVNRAVVFSNITPIVSVLAGVLLLGEPFSFIYIIGIVLIITGVYQVNKTE